MRTFLKLFGIIFLLASAIAAQACSMSKVTRNGTTIVGNNEDSWRTTPQIWFEPATERTLGCCFVGNADRWPQGGMNTAGLVYDAFTMYPSNVAANGKTYYGSLDRFLVSVLQQCRSVQEVYEYAIQYDRSRYNRAMMMFVDSTGAYLVMEADTMIIGNDPEMVLTNFSYARRTDPEVHFQERYFRGLEFLKQQGTGFDFSRDLMQLMSECRARKGDGTTYTTLYDVATREVRLYFYHDYTKVFTFQLDAELAKGEHTIMMEDVFPANAEFVTLKNYITPATHMQILPYMLAVLVVLMFLAAGIATQWFRQLHQADARLQYFRIAFAVLNALLGIYVMILMNEKAPYYFPAPYHEAGRGWINILSYMPFLLVPAIAFAVYLLVTGKVAAGKSGRWLYAGNLFIWSMCCLVFAYWGFYAV